MDGHETQPSLDTLDAMVARAVAASGRQDARARTDRPYLSGAALSVGPTNLVLDYSRADDRRRPNDFAINCTEYLKASAEPGAYVVTMGGRREVRTAAELTDVLTRWIRDEGRRQDAATLPQRASVALRDATRRTAIHRPRTTDRLARAARAAVVRGQAAATPEHRQARREAREALAPYAPAARKAGPAAARTIEVPAPAAALDSARIARLSSTRPALRVQSADVTRPRTTAPSRPQQLER